MRASDFFFHFENWGCEEVFTLGSVFLEVKTFESDSLHNFILNIQVRLTTCVSISARSPDPVDICKHKYFAKEQLKTPECWVFLTLHRFDIWGITLVLY